MFNFCGIYDISSSNTSSRNLVDYNASIAKKANDLLNKFSPKSPCPSFDNKPIPYSDKYTNSSIALINEILKDVSGMSSQLQSSQANVANLTTQLQSSQASVNSLTAQLQSSQASNNNLNAINIALQSKCTRVTGEFSIVKNDFFYIPSNGSTDINQVRLKVGESELKITENVSDFYGFYIEETLYFSFSMGKYLEFTNGKIITGTREYPFSIKHNSVTLPKVTTASSGDVVNIIVEFLPNPYLTELNISHILIIPHDLNTDSLSYEFIEKQPGVRLIEEQRQITENFDNIVFEVPAAYLQNNTYKFGFKMIPNGNLSLERTFFETFEVTHHVNLGI